MMTKAVLDRLGVVYEEIDIDQDPGAAATVLAINGLQDGSDRRTAGRSSISRAESADPSFSARPPGGTLNLEGVSISRSSPLLLRRDAFPAQTN